MLIISRVLSTIFMIVMNTLAITLPLNGMTTEALSDMLQTFITPAGFTFAIWSVIYLALIALTIAVALKKVRLSDQAMVWYIISALANGLRIVARHYQSLHLSMIIILVLLVSLIMIDRILKSNSGSIFHYNRVRNVILFYFGRVQIATLVMFTVYLQYQLGWIVGYEIQAGMAVIILAGCANLLVICREKNIITSLVAVRALWGIINGQTDPQIIMTTQVVIGLLVAGIAWDTGKKVLRK